MWLQEKIRRTLVNKLIATAEGRAHILNILADAEANGENRVFEQLLARIDDPDLQKFVRKHQADEVRHAEMFYSCVRRTGFEPKPVPPELQLISRIDKAVGGFLNRAIETDLDVMRAYLVLQVIEERALSEFSIFEAAFRPIDPETAEVFVAIGADEERHLKYCHAVARRYAPDEATHRATLAELRQIEAGEFAEINRLDFEVLQPLYKFGPVGKYFWPLLVRLAPVPTSTRVRSRLASGAVAEAI